MNSSIVECASCSKEDISVALHNLAFSKEYICWFLCIVSSLFNFFFYFDLFVIQNEKERYDIISNQKEKKDFVL